MDDDGVQLIRFDGRWPYPDGSSSRFSVAGSFRKYDPTDLNLEIFWHGETNDRRRAAVAFLANRNNHLWISNEKAIDGHVELLGLNGHETTYVGQDPISTSVQFWALQKGIHADVVPEDHGFYLTAKLTPSGFFNGGLVERHATGEIKVTSWPKQGPILIQSEFGELTVEQTYDYEDKEELGNRITKQIPQSTIHGKITVPKGSSLYAVNEKIKAEFELTCVALSLCFRQRVDYFQVSYRDVVLEAGRVAFCRRKLPETKAKAKRENFIHPQAQAAGGLQRIIAALRSSPQREDLQRAITFLASSYDASLENAFFMAFSAMETLVNIGAGAELSGKVLNKRSPFHRRVKLACTAFRPATSDLWPNREFLDGMREAAKIRNGLFHAAEYSDGNALVESLVRVRAFAERLAAKIIAWPDAELWRWRDQDLRSVNRSTTSSPAAGGQPAS